MNKEPAGVLAQNKGLSGAGMPNQLLSSNLSQGGSQAALAKPLPCAAWPVAIPYRLGMNLSLENPDLGNPDYDDIGP